MFEFDLFPSRKSFQVCFIRDGLDAYIFGWVDVY